MAGAGRAMLLEGGGGTVKGGAVKGGAVNGV